MKTSVKTAGSVIPAFHRKSGAKLMAERESVRAALQADSGDAAALRSGWDERDSASERNVREVEWRQLEGLYKRLTEIDQALDRLMDGVYGRCVECGEEIERKRLTADPATAFCLSCREKQETGFRSMSL